MSIGVEKRRIKRKFGKMNSELIMYKTEDYLTKMEVTFDGDTVWLSIDKMVELFQRNKSTI